jgi:membrane-bound lytic murein transglycosylase D
MLWHGLVAVISTLALWMGAIGCAATRGAGGVESGATVAVASLADTLESDSLYLEVDSVEADPAALVSSMVDTLLSAARTACDEERFAGADSLLREAVTALDSSTIPTEDAEELAAFYHPRIIELYTEAMPKRFLDSIPAHIAFMAFQHQISRSLDSIVVSDKDSAFLAELNCRKGVPYNLPITWNERVLRAVYVFTSRKPATVERWLSRANHYLPFMKALMADSGLPTDLAYLPLIESGYNPRAYSYAHASGIWQFIPSTGRIYGLRNGYWLDERRDPIKSTKSAIAYLKKLYGDFGDWYLALAAYNCGENCVSRAIARANSSDFWDLTLPRQTMDYVPKFLASLMVAKNPHCFGFEIPPVDPFDLDTTTVDDCVDLNVIARGIDVPLEELKELNPHVRRFCTPPDAGGVTLYLPRGKRRPCVDFLATLTDNDKVRWYRYRIRRGDNLIGIARRFRLSVPAIKSINALRSSRIVAGRYLLIPIPVDRRYPSGATVASTETATPSAPPPKPPDTKAIRYRVKSGDTMWGLAETFGVSVEQIRRWNDISHARHLRAGKIITLYTDDTPASRPAVVAPPPSPPSPSPRSAAVPEEGRGSRRSYTVRTGDNLYAISRTLGTPLDKLIAWNGKDPHNPLIHPGEKLVYYHGDESAPVAASSPSPRAACSRCIRYRVKRGDNLSSLARLFSVELSELLELNRIAMDHVLHEGDILLIPDRQIQSADKRESKRVVYYRVEKGDNLWSISRLFNIPMNDLYRLNGLGRQSVLMPGDTIRVVLAEEL